MTEAGSLNNKDQEREEKVNSVVAGVEFAYFESFQEYPILTAKRENGQLVQGEMLPREAAAQNLNTAKIIKRYLRFLDNPSTPDAEINYGNLYCFADSATNKHTVEGLGRIHLDISLRKNPSVFHMEFSNSESQEAFINLLKDNPKLTLSEVFGQVFDNRFATREYPVRITGGSSNIAKTDRRMSPFKGTVSNLTIGTKKEGNSTFDLNRFSYSETP